MHSLHNIINGLTSEAPTSEDKSTLVQRFASELGWTPSYYLTPSSEREFVNIHLVVEHGLENSAIITFLKSTYFNLSDKKRRELLNISYNNMVDWHLQVEQNKIIYVNNRLNPVDNIVASQEFQRDQYDVLRSESFEKIIGRRKSPNIPPLDDALINTISFWKRNISAELGYVVDNESLSQLFNSIIFLRALEDNYKHFNSILLDSRIMLDAWGELPNSNEFLTNLFKLTLQKLNRVNVPNYLIDFNQLKIFNSLNRQVISYLLTDFYINKQTSFYNYDFSVMSKHALSRIYEKYVAVLKVESKAQLSLFAQLPQEINSRAYGAIYTPQYIARFFARYLKENISPIEFSKIRVADPAVGSGIFLRSLLELKSDPRQEFISNAHIKESFNEILGLDVDPNACKAAELSLALLQLVLTNEFPENLNIKATETISYVESNSSLKETFDAVFANPPYISTTGQTDEMRGVISKYMKDFGKGRVDSFLAFLKIGMDLLKPGGYGMYVLPHSFLMSNSGRLMRKELVETCWIRCIADLSAIEVFENASIYVILLIFQKKSLISLNPPKVTILKCRDNVGKALQDVIRRNFRESSYYSVYEISQDILNKETWHILPNSENRLESKLSNFKPISHFLSVKQGFVTGADNIFILEKGTFPEEEKELYISYLPDKKMNRYVSHYQLEQFLFFPFLGGKKVELEVLQNKYPWTYNYLLSKKSILMSKKSSQNENWWKPLRTRRPEDILQPKIITPHLTITPKFSIDLNGAIVVSRSPYLIPKNEEVEGVDLLLFFLAVLNSTPCYWYISNHSHKYREGYSMLEVKTLEQTPVPDPTKVPAGIIKKIIELVKMRLLVSFSEALSIEKQLDEIICDLYNINQEEKNILGII